MLAAIVVVWAAAGEADGGSGGSGSNGGCVLARDSVPKEVVDLVATLAQITAEDAVVDTAGGDATFAIQIAASRNASVVALEPEAYWRGISSHTLHYATSSGAVSAGRISVVDAAPCALEAGSKAAEAVGNATVIFLQQDTDWLDAHFPQLLAMAQDGARIVSWNYPLAGVGEPYAYSVYRFRSFNKVVMARAGSNWEAAPPATVYAYIKPLTPRPPRRAGEEKKCAEPAAEPAADSAAAADGPATPEEAAARRRRRRDGDAAPPPAPAEGADQTL